MKEELDNWVGWLQARIPELKAGHNEFWIRQALNGYKDIKPKTKKKMLQPNWSSIISGFDKQTEFTRWLVYRKSLGKSIKVQETQDRLAEKFNNTDIETIRQVVNHSIDNQYQGLFWDKFKNYGTTTTKKGIDNDSLNDWVNS